MLDFKLKQDYKAQNVNINDDGYDNDLPKFKEFKGGQRIRAMKYTPKTDEALKRFGDDDNILVDNAFIIPKSIVNKIGLEMPEEFKKNATMFGKGLGTQLREGAKSYYTGAVIGAVVGGLTAVYFKRKILLFAGLGAMGGGYIGYKLVEGKNSSGFVTTIKQI
jgi:hypothetical protein